MPTLLMTPRQTEDSRALWKVAAGRGWRIERLAGWAIPDALREVESPVLYTEALFGPTFAEKLGVTLLDPPEDWLARLPQTYRRRKIVLTTLADARQRTSPAFIKPPNDKSFPAGVYVGSALPDDYDDAMPVLVSEVVHWQSEFRCFVLDREVRTFSLYCRDGELQRDSGFESSDEEDREMLGFVQQLLEDVSVDLPRAIVIDVGFIPQSGWACVELNAAWGAGLYACDPAAALDVIRHATVQPRN